MKKILEEWLTEDAQLIDCCWKIKQKKMRLKIKTSNCNVKLLALGMTLITTQA